MNKQVAWTLIRSGFGSGAWNMALDEALLHAVEEGRSGPVLRLYRWQPATVTLGYFQSGSSVVNLEACSELGYDVVRRITGGRAVLHDREVTYAVVSRDNNEMFPGAVEKNYRVIADVLQALLDSFGIDAAITSGRQAPDQAEGVQQTACFTAPALSELVYRGCKMTGGSQKRMANSFLQHGSIPVDLDPVKLWTALDTSDQPDTKKGAALLERKVGWINRWRSSAVTVEDVEDRFAEVFARVMSVDMQVGEPDDKTLEHARRLAAEKYSSDSWNLKGLPVA